MHFVIFTSETSFVSTDFSQGGDLHLNCSVTTGTYSAITVSKVQGQGQAVEVLAVFHGNGSTEIKAGGSRSSASRVMNQGVTFMTLTLTNTNCGDEGRYTCSHDNGQTSTGEVLMESECWWVHQ